jgi:hypothetical protein
LMAVSILSCRVRRGAECMRGGEVGDTQNGLLVFAHANFDCFKQALLYSPTSPSDAMRLPPLLPWAGEECLTKVRTKPTMRRLIKFLHTLGAIGLMGAMASLVVMLLWLPAPTALESYAALRTSMAAITQWVFMPSLGLTLIAGLIAIAVNPVFHNAGWAWVKAVSGILIFEGGLVSVMGPMQHEAELAAKVLAGTAAAKDLGQSLRAEEMTLWILLAVSAANVVFGIWRPKLMRGLRE